MDDPVECSDCVHYEACIDMYDEVKDEFDDNAFADCCEFFKNKADFVEVVRCKDCKHFTEGMAVGMCKRIEDKPIIPCCFDNFCKYGERRED